MVDLDDAQLATSTSEYPTLVMSASNFKLAVTLCNATNVKKEGLCNPFVEVRAPRRDIRKTKVLCLCTTYPPFFWPDSLAEKDSTEMHVDCVQTCQRTRNPAWDERFEYSGLREDDVLHIEILDFVHSALDSELLGMVSRSPLLCFL